MRIVLATPIYPPEIGGPATHVKTLEEELRKAGFEIEVVKFSDVRHLPKVFRHIAYCRLVLRAARTGDVVSIHDTVSVGVPATIAARIAGKPSVVCVPGDYAWEQARQRFGVIDGIDEFQGKTYGIRVAFLRALQRFTARSARLVIVPSEYFGRVVRGWGVTPEHLRVVYNSVEIEESLLPVNDGYDGHTIFSAGRLVPWKGFAGLIEILAELPEWRLVIVGDGPDKARLQTLATERGVANRVIFTGALSHAEVYGWLAMADAFVLNTSFESFSYQVAEALIAGIPIITTRVGSLPELIDDGVEGVLVEPDDKKALIGAIKSVAADPEIWKQRVAAGKRKAQRFTTEAMIRQFAELYRDIGSL